MSRPYVPNRTIRAVGLGRPHPGVAEGVPAPIGPADSVAALDSGLSLDGSLLLGYFYGPLSIGNIISTLRLPYQCCELPVLSLPGIPMWLQTHKIVSRWARVSSSAWIWVSMRGRGGVPLATLRTVLPPAH